MALSTIGLQGLGLTDPNADKELDHDLIIEIKVYLAAKGRLDW